MDKPFDSPQPLDLPRFGLPPWLYEDAAAGVQISGDSGSGKSTLMATLMERVIRARVGLVLLDPHGDLARLMQDLCLTLGTDVVRRTYFIRPADPTVVTPINPLFVDAEGLSPLQWRARLSVKVAHVARILLHAWGERDFNSKPLMFKWVTRFLRSVGALGLPLADVCHFFNTQSPLFGPLVNAIPDLMSRLELMELARLRPTEREEFIASTKNRFLGFLENPIVEAILSRVEGAVDLRWHMKNRSILLVDLSPLGNLRPEDQEILANLWLNQVLHTVYNMPENEREPFFCFVDELPVFSSCAPQLCDASRQVRKMKCRFVAAHQGTTFFPNKLDDPLLNAMIGQFATHLYFRHANPVDAHFFGQVLSLPSYSATREKHRLVQPQQYQDGFDLVVLQDESHQSSTTNSAGRSETTGTTSQTSQTHQSATSTAQSEGESRQEDALRATLSKARQKARNTGVATGNTHGDSHSLGHTWSQATTEGTTKTLKQTLVPVQAWRDVISNITFYTPEEHVQETASILSRLPTGQTFFHVASKGVALVQVPMLADPRRETPKFIARKRETYLAELLTRPEYVSPNTIEAEREQTLLAYVRALQTMTPAPDRLMPMPGDSNQSRTDIRSAGDSTDPDSPLRI